MIDTTELLETLLVYCPHYSTITFICCDLFFVCSWTFFKIPTSKWLYGAHNKSYVFLFLKDALSGSDNMAVMYPEMFDRLLAFIEFAVHPPKFGKVDTRSLSAVRNNQVSKIFSSVKVR